MSECDCICMWIRADIPFHEFSFGRLSCSFRPRGNLVPLPKLAGAEEEAAGKSGGDPSPPESAESKVESEGATGGDPFPRLWPAVVSRLPASLAKRTGFVQKGSGDLRLHVRGDCFKVTPFELVVAQ